MAGCLALILVTDFFAHKGMLRDFNAEQRR